MANESGHFPNTFYLDQAQQAHLNGAALFDSNERDVAPLLAQMSISGTATTAGAILQKTGTLFITEALIDALTLAAPTATVDDNKSLTIVSTTAFAHTVTTPSNVFNGGKSIATFANVAGNGIELKAWQGVWYVIRNTGITLS